MSNIFETGKIVLTSTINEQGQRECDFQFDGRMSNWEAIALLEQAKLTLWLQDQVDFEEEE